MHDDWHQAHFHRGSHLAGAGRHVAGVRKRCVVHVRVRILIKYHVVDHLQSMLELLCNLAFGEEHALLIVGEPEPEDRQGILVARHLRGNHEELAPFLQSEMLVAFYRRFDLAQPDLILMDITLPDINGEEATRRLKAHPATKGIPVIALTANAMNGDRENAIAAGCDDFDTKPVDMPRLLGKIRALQPQ
jgi:CheY-like chemotaxis protein